MGHLGHWISAGQAQFKRVQSASCSFTNSSAYGNFPKTSLASSAAHHPHHGHSSVSPDGETCSLSASHLRCNKGHFKVGLCPLLTPARALQGRVGGCWGRGVQQGSASAEAVNFVKCLSASNKHELILRGDSCKKPDHFTPWFYGRCGRSLGSLSSCSDSPFLHRLTLGHVKGWRAWNILQRDFNLIPSVLEATGGLQARERPALGFVSLEYHLLLNMANWLLRAAHSSSPPTGTA